MNNNWLGMAIAAAGLYFGYYGMTTSGDVSVMIWLKALVGIVGGGGYLAYNNREKVTDFLSKLNLWKSSGPSPTTDTSDEFSIKKLQDKDLEYLYYLTERVKNTSDGMQLCGRLNIVLFTLHHSETDVVVPPPQEEVK